MSEPDIPIACDLSQLDAGQRQREQSLLRRFRERWTRESETEDGVWFSGSTDPADLSELGEFLALERLCCPFLKFQLEVSREPCCRLYISGPPGARDLVLPEFTPPAAPG